MQFNDTQLDAVQQFLQAGNLLAYPTEAVWGIGCDPFNETAVKQILAIKQRPIEKGMIVITGDIAHIQPFLQPLPQQVVNTIAASWRLAMHKPPLGCYRFLHHCKAKSPSGSQVGEIA